MEKRKKPKKTRKMLTARAKSVGPIPETTGLWRVRFKVPRLPFYLQSAVAFGSLEDAAAWAEKWKSRDITVKW